MRPLRWLLVLVVLAAAALGVGDVVARDHVQSAVASRIEARAPGSRARVRIASFPFLARLAVDGQVLHVEARVSRVAADHVELTHVDLRLDGLRVSRHAILSGKLDPVSLRSGSVTAEISQASLGTLAGHAVAVGAGTLRVDGRAIAAAVHVHGAVVTVDAGSGFTVSVRVPSLAILPCVSSARLVPGALQVSCRFSGLPPALAGNYSL